MVRGLLKRALASAAHVSWADRIAAAVAARGGRTLVLGYHRVVDDFTSESATAFPAMLISRRMLERHVDWIARRFQVVALEDLPLHAEARSRRHRPLAAITFDDGYRDVYEHAFPLLMRKGLPATVFVATDYVGTPSALPHDRLYLLLTRASRQWRAFSKHLLRVLRRLDLPLALQTMVAASRSVDAALRTLITSLPSADVLRVIDALETDCGPLGGVPRGVRLMSWAMLREMSRAGISIGSHTKSHALLINESRGRVIDETSGSQDTLATELGRPAAAFAYPDGRFDTTSVRAVAAAGYRVAVTTCHHRDPHHPWLTVPRMLFWERSSADLRGGFSPAVMSCQVSGLLNPFVRCQQRHRSVSIHSLSYGERDGSGDRFGRTVPLSGR
jgi:peptidoglycan/xylan/chitin deacetylase (PgdA/CDA1 family)